MWQKIFHAWYRHFADYIDRLDARCFPELLFMSECKYFKDSNPAYAEVFENKNVLPLLVRLLEMQMPTLVHFYVKLR